MCNGCEQLSVFWITGQGGTPTATRHRAVRRRQREGAVTPAPAPPPPRPGWNGWHCTPAATLGHHHSGVDHERN